MTEAEKAAAALQMVNAANIKAGDASVVVEVQTWLQGIADGGERQTAAEIPTIRDSA